MTTSNTMYSYETNDLATTKTNVSSTRALTKITLWLICWLVIRTLCNNNNKTPFQKTQLTFSYLIAISAYKTTTNNCIYLIPNQLRKQTCLSACQTISLDSKVTHPQHNLLRSSFCLPSFFVLLSRFFLLASFSLLLPLTPKGPNFSQSMDKVILHHEIVQSPLTPHTITLAQTPKACFRNTVLRNLQLFNTSNKNK